MIQKLIFTYFIYLILEGAFRKWLLPGFSQQLFLFKDLILAFGAFLLAGQAIMHRNINLARILSRRDIVTWLLWIFFFVGHIIMTGFSLPGLIGLRYYLIMLPILVLIPIAVRDIEHLNSLTLKYFYLTIPVGILGIVQFMSPASARINTYAWTVSEMAVATLGEQHARITGTFSYIAPYAIYLQCMLLIGLCMYLCARDTRKRMVIVLSVALILSNISMTGSRAPLLIAGILSIPMVLKIFVRKETRQFSTVFSMLLAVALLFIFANPFSLLLERNKGARDSEVRISGALNIPLHTLMNSPFAGKGVGSTFGGMTEATGEQHEDSGFEEVVIDRIGIEVGLFGYLLVLLIKISYLLETYRFYQRVLWEDIRTWALTSLLIQLSTIWSIPVYNSIAAAYYFASLAIYFKMRQFARERALVPIQ